MVDPLLCVCVSHSLPLRVFGPKGYGMFPTRVEGHEQPSVAGSFEQKAPGLGLQGACKGGRRPRTPCGRWKPQWQFSCFPVVLTCAPGTEPKKGDSQCSFVDPHTVWQEFSEKGSWARLGKSVFLFFESRM